MGDEYDYCYECALYDNNYFYDEETDEWENACEACPCNFYRYADDWDD